MSAWAPLAWLAYRLRPAGDAALRGLEAELSRVTTFDEGWARVCDTAWSLGFVELRLLPLTGASDLLEERQGFAPRPWPLLGQGLKHARAEATWAIGLTLAGSGVGTLTARRLLNRMDFEPMRLVAAVQGLVDRFGALKPPSTAGALEPRLRLLEDGAPKATSCSS